MNLFIDKVKDTIKKYGMLKRGRSLCVAVSGGVDSMVLLRVLYVLKDELFLKLSVCHVNHNLRGSESRRDLAFVRDASRKMGFRFMSTTLKKANSPSAKAFPFNRWRGISASALSKRR